MHLTKIRLFGLVLSYLLASATPSLAEPNNVNTDWFKDARYGVFMHFLPADAKGLALVNDFDVEALAGQLEMLGAKYFVITPGQNSGYFISPNAAYDEYTGYAPGERCSRRDLPLDLHAVLKARGIRLMLYLPCQTPNGDRRAQKAFGLPEGAKDLSVPNTPSALFYKHLRLLSARLFTATIEPFRPESTASPWA
jgi:hypothetical protein